MRGPNILFAARGSPLFENVRKLALFEVPQISSVLSFYISIVDDCSGPMTEAADPRRSLMTFASLFSSRSLTTLLCLTNLLSILPNYVRIFLYRFVCWMSIIFCLLESLRLSSIGSVLFFLLAPRLSSSSLPAPCVLTCKR